MHQLVLQRSPIAKGPIAAESPHSPHAMIEEPKFTGGYINFRERVSAMLGTDGFQMSLQELSAICDEWYCVNPDYSHQCLTANGTWASKRARRNDRGCKSSVLSRKLSVESIGIVAQRLGPWIIEAKPGSGEKDEVMHWATLLDGAEMAYNADVDKTNKTLQWSVRRPILHGKKYHWKVPDDARDFLKDLGNVTNAEVLVVTI